MTCFNIIIWTSAVRPYSSCTEQNGHIQVCNMLLGFLAKLIHFYFIVSSEIHQHIINLLQKVAKVGLQFPQHPPLSQG